MSTVQNSVEQQKAQERKKREDQRRGWSLALIVIGIFLAWIGTDYVVFEFLPVPVFGAIVSGAGVLGLLGVNIYAGGPLDRTKDPR